MNHQQTPKMSQYSMHITERVHLFGFRDYIFNITCLKYVQNYPAFVCIYGVSCADGVRGSEWVYSLFLGCHVSSISLFPQTSICLCSASTQDQTMQKG